MALSNEERNDNRNPSQAEPEMDARAFQLQLSAASVISSWFWYHRDVEF